MNLTLSNRQALVAETRRLSLNSRYHLCLKKTFLRKRRLFGVLFSWTNIESGGGEHSLLLLCKATARTKETLLSQTPVSVHSSEADAARERDRLCVEYSESSIVISLGQRKESSVHELWHSYPCPCPSQFVEHLQTTNGCSMKFVELLWAGVRV